MASAGWEASAEAWIASVDTGNEARKHILDPVMLREAGDVRGLRVLDVGCGEGRFCRMLTERGARCLGIDPTSGLVRTAAERGSFVVRATGERMPVAPESFDLVISYLTLVDIPDFRAAIGEMARVLRPGGRLLLANVSFTTAMEPWVRDDQGVRQYRRMWRYLDEREVVLEWKGISITNYHRPLSAYMDAFLGNALTLERFLEPLPEDERLRDHPDMEDNFRIPEFVVMRWRKG